MIAPERVRLLRWAQLLAVFSISWNVIEGVVALVAASSSGSSALAGFGFDSGVESISATVLLWRLTAERRNPRRAARVELLAARGIGVSFLLLAAVVASASIRSLVTASPPEASPIGIALTALSLVVMPLLAVAKRRVATALRSDAARADSSQTWACVALSAVVVVGLLLNATLGWWWADPVAALVVSVVLVIEGLRALRSRQVDDCC